ncbi:uncharacterized protein LOC114541155 [Dendronephthya gigantea]|uniref:uncharacterized protein LOC114541155 n=1 Tax=Dendronephthya gigantea TaxID=151771 RepID=UPI00106CC735|nr:uncharacterized protein LOC114541155 [Dendronephthya gigantea]
MSKGDRVPEEIKSFLRSVLISSNGVKQSRVQKDYHELAGERLMWKNYGFSSLNEFLKALPDVCMLQYSPKDKENRVYAVQKEGTYMSSHAKKNAKVASSSISPIKETNLAENGRIVQNDGEKIRVTVANTPLNTSSESESSDLLPNSDGLYQVYVVKLPEKCTETELRNCFQIYGKVVECQVVRSSIGKKIGFIRYSLKNEAQLALTEGRRNPPKIFGVTLEVGKTKKKSNDNIETSVNAALNSEPSEGSISSFSSSTPSSPIKSNAPPTALQDQQAKNNLPTAPHFPTYRPMNTQSNSPQTTGNSQPYLAENPPHNTQTPLSVQLPPTQLANTGNNGPWILDPNSTTKTLLSLQPVSETKTSSKEPTNAVSKPLEKVDNRLNYSLVISGYDRKLTEANIKQVFQNVHDLQRIKYQPHYSIAWFKTKDASLHAVNELNGKYCNGCVLLVKPLTKHPSDMDEAEPVKIVDEEKLPVEFQDEFTKIYDFFSEAISGCCRQDYLHWLNNLPSIFEVKIMDLIDPCTFWVHLSDGTNAYRDFNELTHQLSLIKPSSGLSCLKNNEFGAGQFSDDGLWYRCYCREASTDGRLLHVIYIDYGNTEWLERQRTVKLNDSYFKLRPQGILVKLSGFRFKSSNNSELDSKLLSTAKNLLMFKCFQARRGSVDSSKPFLLEIELLQSKGESVLSELESLSGVETRQKESSPPPPLLLSGQPPVPTIVKPPKDTFSSVDSEIHYVWITNIKSPTTFNFQLVNSSSREAIKRIQEMLLKCNIQNKVNVKDPKISNLVCYHKNGLERSRVTFISSTGTPGKVTVLHVDTGKVAVVPLMSFIALPQEAKDIPYQGRPAILYRVPQDPLAKSAKALEFIIQQATEVLQAIIVNENKDGSVYVELFNAEGASINRTLIEMANTERELSKATPPSEVSRQTRKISTEALHNGDQSDPKSMTPSLQCDGGEAVFSSGAPIQSQSISPSGSSRAPQSQSQVSSRRGELERGHVSPGNQASARVMQGLSNQHHPECPKT